MSYLLMQILACLLVAGLIGLIIGWWLRGGCRDKLLKVENEWKTRYDTDKEIWQGKIDSAQNFVEKDIRQNDENWNLKLKDAESNWENKIQGVMGNYDTKVDDLNKEVEELKTKLATSQDRAKEAELQLKESELSWESKIQSLKSDCDAKIAQTDRDKQLLKADLESTKGELKKANQELIKADKELFSTVGNVKECYEVEEIQGIGPGYGKKFRSLGVNTTCDFSNKFLNDDDAVKKASNETKIDFKAIKSWASMADLMRLPGADGQYAEILQAVGVASREELRKSDAKTLYTKMLEYNKAHSIVPEVPSLELILRWIQSPDNSKIVQAIKEVNTSAKDLNECYEIQEIEGIGPGYAKRFNSIGINTSCDLADAYLRDDDAVKKASKKIKVDFNAIKSWASMADLMRLPGVGGQFAEIMQVVGVNSQEELAGFDVNSLHSKMVEFNTKKPIVPEVPSKDMLSDWIAIAKKV